MHEALGTLVSGGTLRFSIGPFNTSEDIDATIAAVQEVAANV
jgi:cysteine sulfinate desulfinase/cysteine desulfurase-like protein